ncbi:Phosphoribosylformylglycinamidine cyclo-ligase [compost metagenome]
MQNKGNVTNRDMFTTFNMGIGLVLVVPAEDGERTLELLKAGGEEAYLIGTVTEGERIVTFTGAEV